MKISGFDEGSIARSYESLASESVYECAYTSDMIEMTMGSDD